MPDKLKQRALKQRILAERNGTKTRLTSSLVHLKQQIESAERSLAEGGRVNAHLIANASMITEEIARWNLALDLWPFVDDDAKMAD